GGGVVGCGVARELSRFNASVLVLEKTADICNGASKANTAIVHGGYDAKPHTYKAKFNVEGNALFPALCKELDVPYENNTSLVVSFGMDGHAELEALKRRGEENGVEGLRIIDQNELRGREPNIGATAYEALLVPTGGIVCPYELTQAFAENAAANGAEFRRNAAVTHIERQTDDLWRVTSTAGTFLARAVVNCAGLYADVINNMVSEDKLTIHPRRGEYYLVDKAYAGTFHAAMFQLPTPMGKGILVAPTVDGTILLGPSAEDIENKDDTATTADGLKKVLEQARLTWENIPMRGFITTFAGIRAHCDRDDFVIGEASDAPFFFNAAGIESPGLTSAPAIARFLAAMIADRLTLVRNRRFNPIHKGIDKFRNMTDKERMEAIARNPDYAKIVCRCETVTEAEIREAIRRPVGARTMDGIKRRTRAGMGRCQAGFCTQRTLEILAEELKISPLEVTKCGGNSKLIQGYLFEEGGEA
ncbi:MAG: NAD(P)/FAD-dependent oxidoreductase, partial [Clostridia bacterium]|nr:NAD(P)/FAD-dependent oxidoreductase [Clostridia bacterium]